MRFAYLIMAHDNPKQLEILLKLLDYPENEIFLHIDKKNTDIKIGLLENIICNAKLHVYKKFRVYWADLSQTKCQFFLLEKATKEYHDYYHLLSGHDLPLKKHEEIQKFFEINKGREFVHFESKDYCEKEACIYYHFFQPWIQRANSSVIRRLLKKLEYESIRLQKKAGIHRNLYCGANWFSISNALANDLLSNKRKLLHLVHYTISSDEYVLQSFIKRVSKKKYEFYCVNEDDYHSVIRAIDWNRGKPYVWQISDADTLMDSEMMYARKFDMKIDTKIINFIKENIE